LQLRGIFIAEIAADYLTPPILFAILPQSTIYAVAEGSQFSGYCRKTWQSEGLAIIEQPSDAPAGPDVKTNA
jgi:hypothetical protein